MCARIRRVYRAMQLCFLKIEGSSKDGSTKEWGKDILTRWGEDLKNT